MSKQMNESKLRLDDVQSFNSLEESASGFETVRLSRESVGGETLLSTSQLSETCSIVWNGAAFDADWEDDVAWILFKRVIIYTDVQ